MKLHNQRENYDKYHLKVDQIEKDPFLQFESWYRQAEKDKNIEPNTMILATSVNNMPNARVVLLKAVEEGNFSFFTNYRSTKGEEIQINPNVMLLFYWNMSQRQVRIKGTIQKMSREKSVTYFKSRPIESQISAMASPQSHRIELEELTDRVEAIKENELSCPEDWGGYLVSPSYFEFWQGQPGRLHDRIVFEKKNDNKWEIYRLAP